jgi:3-hydroxyacyl-CoA dehydrogenase
MRESGRPARVGLLGGGVIGGGWAARFLLHGSDVTLYDPAPDADKTVSHVLRNARLAAEGMGATLPPEGRLAVVDSPEEAVSEAEFVQESAPERLALKQGLLARACAACPPGVVMASSTSGLMPSRICAEMPSPQRFIVGHPFNPVYLLPLVEVVAGEDTAPETVEHAVEVYRSVGMRPLVVRREIDGFIADRLLEALWREALWLVNDGIATAEEVDDAIRLGPGLRFAFMGPFLTYRMGGGEGGMRHFLHQFGPSLQWPWTKLMDVPDLTDELIETIVEQSDDQAAGRSPQELEQMRDRYLVAVLRALREQDGGAPPQAEASPRGS